MVNLQVRQGTAYLAPPAVSPEYVLAELLVILLIEPDRRLFRQDLLHGICSFTICAKACLCSPGRNLKNWESARRSTLESPPSRFAPARKSAQISSRQYPRERSLPSIRAAVSQSLLDHRNLAFIQ